MASLLQQLKKRRIALGLKQHDMMLRIGMSRQQYQRLESGGNPRLETLELIAQGLNSEIMLIPREKIQAVKAILAGSNLSSAVGEDEKNREYSLADDPWKGLLEDDEDLLEDDDE